MAILMVAFVAFCQDRLGQRAGLHAHRVAGGHRHDCDPRGDGANLGFADGHVEFHKWKYPHRIRNGAERDITNALDLQDLRWLLSRVPGPR